MSNTLGWNLGIQRGLLMWKDFHSKFEGLFSGERAFSQASEQNRLERYFTFPNFEKSAERAGEEFTKAGLEDVEVEEFPADNKTSWSGWGDIKAWDVESARLWMVSPEKRLLYDWDEIPQSLVMYSGSYDGEFEIVEWDGETDVDLGGKIPFTSRRINDVYPQMRVLGIKGIISDFIGTLPGVREPFDIPDAVRWENGGLEPAGGECWGFMISPRCGTMLRDLIKKRGSVTLRAEIESRNYEGIFKSATGVIKGSELPEEEILFVSHLYEPGGNDNASGGGVVLELARSLNSAINRGIIKRPRRSIRFLLNWEGFGLYAWVHKHKDLVPKILGGLNIDEIGVDQEKGRSILHLFMPPAANPSCVGTLISHLCDKILSPQIRWKSVADRAEIINDTITSDPNIDIVLPCLIQYPSRNYHASSDSLDSLSTEVMERIGLACGAHLYFLANMGGKEASWLADLVAKENMKSLGDTELELLSGKWPFDENRTREWHEEQSAMKFSSIRRYGIDEDYVLKLQNRLTDLTKGMCTRQKDHFPIEKKRNQESSILDKAEALILKRKTLGSPKAWGSGLNMSPEEEKEHRDVLYKNNLDLMFHRIVYWVDGRRSLMDIIEKLEFEYYELLHDTTISRTSSDTHISGGSVEINIKAVSFIVEKLVNAGYLESNGRDSL